MDITYMKAPKGTTSATIQGNEYDIPASGVIEVKNPGHLPTLRRHGFIETDAPAGEPVWDSMDDDALIAYIEEHGGEADDSMKTKKLIRLAKEAYAESQEG